MIETPLDILTHRRLTFRKALYDGLGLQEAALEYLDAHSTIIKSDIFYEVHENENLLLLLAKAEGEFVPASPTFVQDVRYPLAADNLPAVDSTNQDNFFMQPQSNPMMQEVTHRFSDGKTEAEIPAWASTVLSYHKVSPDDEHHAGMSRAEYDAERIKAWLNDGKNRTHKNHANTEEHFGKLQENHMSHNRITNLANLTGADLTNEQYLENVLMPEILDGTFSFTDYLHGLEGISKQDREAIYDYLMEHGYDKNEGQLSKYGISTAQIRYHLGERLKPLLDHLVKSSELPSDNIRARPEKVATEHTEVPNHVFDSLAGTPDKINALHQIVYNHLRLEEKDADFINDVANRLITESDYFPEDALEAAKRANLMRYDLFKYNPRTKSFSMEKLPKPPTSMTQWLRKVTKSNLTRNGLYAAANYNPEYGRMYLPNEHPVAGFKETEGHNLYFNGSEMQKINQNMRTDKDAIYMGTRMRNYGIPWMKRRLHPDYLPDFMGGDNRGFNDLFSHHFQAGAGHDLDLNVALRAIAPLFNRKAVEDGVEYDDNLLFDIEDPNQKLSAIVQNKLYLIGRIRDSDDYKEKEMLQEELQIVTEMEREARDKTLQGLDIDDKLNYIGPKESYKDDGTPIKSTTNAMAFAGQPALTRFFIKVYDPTDLKTYNAKVKRAQLQGIDETNITPPKPRKLVPRSLGHLPNMEVKTVDNPTPSQARTAEIKQRANDRLLNAASTAAMDTSAHFSHYNTSYFGLGAGSGGLDKSHRGQSSAPQSSEASLDIMYGDLGNQKYVTTEIGGKPVRRYLEGREPNERGLKRLQGVVQGESIPGTFSAINNTKRTAIADVIPQIRENTKKNRKDFNRHSRTGGARHPFNPQGTNVLDHNDPQLKVYNDMVHRLFEFASRDDVDREGRIMRDINLKQVLLENALQIASNEKNKLDKLNAEIESLGTTPKDLMERHNLQVMRDFVERQYNIENMRRSRAVTALREAKEELQKEREERPKMDKQDLFEKLNKYMEYTQLPGEVFNQMTQEELQEYQDLENELQKEYDKIKNYTPRHATSTYGKHQSEKWHHDLEATGDKAQHLREEIDNDPNVDFGNVNDPYTMLSNAVVLAMVAEQALHRHDPSTTDKKYRTYSEIGGKKKHELHEGGEPHSSIRDIIRNNGASILDREGDKKDHPNVQLGGYDDHHRISDKMFEVIDTHTHLSPDERKMVEADTKQMSIAELLGHLHPDLKGNLFTQQGDPEHVVHDYLQRMKEILHLDDGYHPTEKTKMIEEQLGIHLLKLDEQDGGPHLNFLNAHIVIDPTFVNGATDLKEHTFENDMADISDVSEHGIGINCFFTDPNPHFKWEGYRPTIKPVYNSRGIVTGFKQVEPYDFASRTMPMSMYEKILPDFMKQWSHTLGLEAAEKNQHFVSPQAFKRLFQKQEDATILLASLSNPDIMLKKDGEYPILQPMHRIFKLDDLEHLRGFSGDWIVSAMPEGPRAFVEKKDDKITVRGDFDLDKETKENFEKISKKNFVVDVVLAGKEYNVIDIVEYDDSDVHDMPLQERIKILRGTMESTENVLLPAAHNLRLTDDVGLEVIVKDLLKEHKRLVLRDANSTYMKGENRHPKWVLYDEGQDVNLMVLDKKGTSSFTYRLGTGPITHEDSLGDRAVEYEGDTYMDVGTSFQSEDEYEVGDIVTVNVDSISVTESVEGADIYTVNSNEIKGEAEGEGVSSVETLSMFTKSEPMMWPHEIDRDGDRIVIKMAAGDVSYRASTIDGEWYMFNPKAENGWLIRLAESQRPFWSPVAGVMLKADLSLYDDESKAEVHESKNDAKPLIPPKKVKNTSFWDSEIDEAIAHKKKVKRLLAKSLTLASSMLKSGVGAVGDSSTGAMGLGIDYATPIESPSGPTSLVGSKTMPDHDARDVERDNKERAEDKKMGHRKPVDDDEAGHLSIDKDKAAFVPY